MEEELKINRRSFIHRNLIAVIRCLKTDPKNIELALKMSEMNSSPDVIVINNGKKEEKLKIKKQVDQITNFNQKNR